MIGPQQRPRAHHPGDHPADLAPRAMAALRRLVRAMDLHSRQLAARSQVTGPQLVCLGRLAEAETLTATELARRVHLSPSTVVRILDRLEARGLVARQRSRVDRRRVLVSATPAGRRLTQRAPAAGQHPVHRALAELPPGDRAELVRLLETLGDLVDARLRGRAVQRAAASGADPHE